VENAFAHNGPYDCVQPRTISPAGEYADSH
jgi:hypothetical protein